MGRWWEITANSDPQEATAEGLNDLSPQASDMDLRLQSEDPDTGTRSKCAKTDPLPRGAFIQIPVKAGNTERRLWDRSQFVPKHLFGILGSDSPQGVGQGGKDQKSRRRRTFLIWFFLVLVLVFLGHYIGIPTSDQPLTAVVLGTNAERENKLFFAFQVWDKI